MTLNVSALNKWCKVFAWGGFILAGLNVYSDWWCGFFVGVGVCSVLLWELFCHD